MKRLRPGRKLIRQRESRKPDGVRTSERISSLIPRRTAISAGATGFLGLTLSKFLIDLEQRGLLDTTLVVWMGEFGRTPKINANISRDHWPSCYTVLLAGGGVKRGYVHGQSDKNGAYPDRDPVPLGDLAATMFAAIGIDPDTELRDKLNRPLPAANGKPVWGVFA